MICPWKIGPEKCDFENWLQDSKSTFHSPKKTNAKYACRSPEDSRREQIKVDVCGLALAFLPKVMQTLMHSFAETFICTYTDEVAKNQHRVNSVKKKSFCFTSQVLRSCCWMFVSCLNLRVLFVFLFCFCLKVCCCCLFCCCLFWRGGGVNTISMGVTIMTPVFNWGKQTIAAVLQRLRVWSDCAPISA